MSKMSCFRGALRQKKNLVLGTKSLLWVRTEKSRGRSSSASSAYPIWREVERAASKNNNGVNPQFRRFPSWSSIRYGRNSGPQRRRWLLGQKLYQTSALRL